MSAHIQQHADPVRPPMRFDDRTVLISGGTRNIGAVTAMSFANLGANVAVLGNTDKDALADTLRDLRAVGADATGQLVDLRDPDGIAAAVESVVADLGPVDILVNNASIRPRQFASEITPEDWDDVMDVNLRAPFLLAQAVLPGMVERRFGRIVNISGLDAEWGMAGRAHATTAKAGLYGLTRALAAECALSGVTVNTVVPGLIDTGRTHPDWYPDLDDFYGRLLKLIPMGRMGEPQEVAWLVLFAACDQSSYMCGQTLFATGGAFPGVRDPQTWGPGMPVPSSPEPPSRK